MKIGNNIDLQKNEIQNVVLHKLSSAPGSPVEGQAYYDTTDGCAKVYNGSAWIAADVSKVAAGFVPMSKLATDPLARANHTGTQLSSTVSDFDTQVRTSRLDQMTAPTAAVSFNSQNITNVADPTLDHHAVNKLYADSLAAGLDAKPSVRVATTANITLSGAQTIDGVSVVADNRVLVKDQSTGSQNGLYLCAAGAWTRTTDCDSSAEYTTAAFVFVEEGTVNAATQWKVSTTGTIVVGTTAVSWTQWGAGSSYTAGAGLALSGNDFAVGAGTGIVVNANDVAIDPAVVVRKYATDIGDTTTTAFTITHNLGTRDVTVSIVGAASTWDAIMTDWSATTTNTITVNFATAPSTNQYRVTVHG